MRKVLFLLFTSIIIGCTANEYTKTRCEELSDTIRNHMSKEWKIYSQFYASESSKYYYKITDGNDSLLVITDGWSGEITKAGIIIEQRAEHISRYNESVERVCKGDSIFRLRLMSNKSLSVHFSIPKK